LKEIQTIRDSRESPLLFLEGPRLIQEALLANFSLEILIISQDFPETAFLAPIRSRSKRQFVVSESVFRVVSDLETPQGVLGICRRPSWTWDDIGKRMPLPLVIFDGIQDPGNAASIMRTAEAAGTSGIVTTPGTARLYSPKALRGAMGSTLRVPVLEHCSIEDIAAQLKKLKCGLLMSRVPQKADNPVLYTKIDWKAPQAILLGQEAKGVSLAWNARPHQTVTLPMQPPVESLNVGAAAAILLYESARQRKFTLK
jgi:RNA methyltransferase, TrmH family